MGAIAIAILATGCGETELDAVPCVASFDCSPREVCISGSCAQRVQRQDAGVTDAGRSQNTVPDASVRDAGCDAPIVTETGATWCSLDLALAQAPAGSILQLPPGIFTQSVVIDTALVLRGSPGTLNSNTVIESDEGRPAVTVRAANVIIENMILQSRSGIGLQLDTGAVVRDVEVRGATDIGILIGGSAIATLERVRVSGVSSAADEGVGIFLAPGARATVSGSVVENVDGNGIEVKGGLLTLRASEVRRSNNYGIHMTNGAEVNIERGSRVLQSEFVGIGVFESTLTMRDSESSANGKPGSALEDGLWLVSPISSIIERSTFSSNTGYGIYCSIDIEPTSCFGNVFNNNGRGDTTCTSSCR